MGPTEIIIIIESIIIGFLSCLVVSIILKNKRTQKPQKARRREDTPCKFVSVSQTEFENIVNNSIKFNRELVASIDGTVVTFTVQSDNDTPINSFKLDFNDYGYVTGKYWLDCENYSCEHSNPLNIANEIKEELSNLIFRKVAQKIRNNQNNTPDTNNKTGESHE